MNKKMWLIVAEGYFGNEEPTMEKRIYTARDAGEAWRIFAGRYSQEMKYTSIIVHEVKRNE